MEKANENSMRHIRLKHGHRICNQLHTRIKQGSFNEDYTTINSEEIKLPKIKSYFIQEAQHSLLLPVKRDEKLVLDKDVKSLIAKCWHENAAKTGAMPVEKAMVRLNALRQLFFQQKQERNRDSNLTPKRHEVRNKPLIQYKAEINSTKARAKYKRLLAQLLKTTIPPEETITVSRRGRGPRNNLNKSIANVRINDNQQLQKNSRTTRVKICLRSNRDVNKSLNNDEYSTASIVVFNKPPKYEEEMIKSLEPVEEKLPEKIGASYSEIELQNLSKLPNMFVSKSFENVLGSNNTSNTIITSNFSASNINANGTDKSKKRIIVFQRKAKCV